MGRKEELEIEPEWRKGGGRPMSYEKYGRFWAVYDEGGNLIAVVVYKKGALEIIRRLNR